MSEQLVHSVFIDLEGDELAYQYMCREGDTVPPLATFRKSVQLSELCALSDGLASALFARVDRSDARLKDWGGKLYDKLIPIDLADKLEADRSNLHQKVLKPLMERGLVVNNKDGRGYYRPAAPPPALAGEE